VVKQINEVKEIKEFREYTKVARQRESGRSNKKFREIKEVDDNTFLISLNYLITLTFNLLYQLVDTAKDAISKFA
jgi:hypothetical protein